MIKEVTKCSTTEAAGSHRVLRSLREKHAYKLTQANLVTILGSSPEERCLRSLCLSLIVDLTIVLHDDFEGKKPLYTHSCKESIRS
jgi:hypothetical protein